MLRNRPQPDLRKLLNKDTPIARKPYHSAFTSTKMPMTLWLRNFGIACENENTVAKSIGRLTVELPV